MRTEFLILLISCLFTISLYSKNSFDLRVDPYVDVDFNESYEQKQTLSNLTIEDIFSPNTKDKKRPVSNKIKSNFKKVVKRKSKRYKMKIRAKKP